MRSDDIAVQNLDLGAERAQALRQQTRKRALTSPGHTRQPQRASLMRLQDRGGWDRNFRVQSASRDEAFFFQPAVYFIRGHRFFDAQEVPHTDVVARTLPHSGVV